MEQHFAFLRPWQRKLYEGGWAGISWPSEYGGRGASLMQQVIFWQEMALRGRAADGQRPGPRHWSAPRIIAFGTDAQKTRYLRKILSAEEIWCQGFSEPNAGSDLAGLQTEARLDGDHFVVNGQKVWTSYGWASDWCELVVRTDPAAPKHKGLTVLLVDMKTPGVEVRPLRQMTGETEFNEVFFHDVRVPVENVVGQVNQGWDVAIGTLMHERGTFGAGLQITYKRNMDRLIELSRDIERNGRPAARRSGDPSEAGAVLCRSRNHARQPDARVQPHQRHRRARAGRIDSEDFLERAEPAPAADRAGAARARTGSSKAGDRHAIDRGAWSYGYLRARGNTIEAGTSEIQRNIIGHFVLGFPRSY